MTSIQTLESLEEVARGNIEPVDGWDAHYQRERDARASVQEEMASRPPVFVGTPVTPDEMAVWDKFWASCR